MADLEEVIRALNESTKERLKDEHNVRSIRRLVKCYERDGGWKVLVGDLRPGELRKSLTVLDTRELQAVVYGALAFDSKANEFFSDDENVAKLSKLKGIMKRLCGWSIKSFTQATYDELIEMLNRFGIDVEESNLHHLEQDGNYAEDRKVRLKRMFVG